MLRRRRRLSSAFFYHLSNQDCDGAVQLRRQEAARTLAGLGVQA